MRRRGAQCPNAAPSGDMTYSTAQWPCWPGPSARALQTQGNKYAKRVHSPRKRAPRARSWGSFARCVQGSWVGNRLRVDVAGFSHARYERVGLNNNACLVTRSGSTTAFVMTTPAAPTSPETRVSRKRACFFRWRPQMIRIVILDFTDVPCRLKGPLCNRLASRPPLDGSCGPAPYISEQRHT